MKCPYCGESDTKVVDSREIDEQKRRRRECEKCSKRFTTYERVENLGIVVIKRDGSKEPFEKGKIKKGILSACTKLPITIEEIDNAAEAIEFKIKSLKSVEVSSKKIAEHVMRRLAKFDAVAYMRYASIHKEFKDIKDFTAELERIQRG
jgi:transcriptional repressor NrdR